MGSAGRLSCGGYARLGNRDSHNSQQSVPPEGDAEVERGVFNERVTAMCGPWAYNDFLKYSAVFPEIANILKASGVKAKVKPTKDKTGFYIQVALPDRTTAVLDESQGYNWSINLGGKAIRLDIPVEN